MKDTERLQIPWKDGIFLWYEFTGNEEYYD